MIASDRPDLRVKGWGIEIGAGTETKTDTGLALEEMEGTSEGGCFVF